MKEAFHTNGIAKPESDGSVLGIRPVLRDWCVVLGVVCLEGLVKDEFRKTTTEGCLPKVWT